MRTQNIQMRHPPKRGHFMAPFYRAGRSSQPPFWTPAKWRRNSDAVSMIERDVRPAPPRHDSRPTLNPPHTFLTPPPPRLCYIPLMPHDTFRDFALDQLRDLPGVTCRAMFGGAGLYRGKTFFGILFQCRLYFKVGAATRAQYERHGMKPFRPNARQTLRSFYEVPADVVENRAELCAWAEQALAAALAGQRPAGLPPKAGAVSCRP